MSAGDTLLKVDTDQDEVNSKNVRKRALKTLSKLVQMVQYL